QRQVRGPRGWLRERWDAYRVFAELARSMTEGMEQWGPHPRPVDLTIDGREIFEGALAEGRGLVVLTGHFGSWEIAARVLNRLGRPVNLVTAHEQNPTVHDFLHSMRTRHGFNVLYSDRSLFAGLPALHALRRHEIVGMQIEPWGPKRGSYEVDFCGRPTRFQLGPFAVARVARAPIVPVFAVRTGIRRYQLRVAARAAHAGRQRGGAGRHRAALRGRRARAAVAVADVRGRVERATGQRRGGRPRLRDGAPGFRVAPQVAVHLGVRDQHRERLEEVSPRRRHEPPEHAAHGVEARVGRAEAVEHLVRGHVERAHVRAAVVVAAPVGAEEPTGGLHVGMELRAGIGSRREQLQEADLVLVEPAQHVGEGLEG